MYKILMVVRREYLAAVKTKMFWIGTLIMPIAMLGFIGISIAAQLVDPEKQKPLALIDETGRLGASISEQLAEHTLKDGSPEFLIESLHVEGGREEARRALEQRVLDDDLYGIVTIGNDLEAEDNFKIFRKSVGDESSHRTIRGAIKEAVVGLRLERSEVGVERDVLAELVAPIRLESYQVSRGGETKQRSFEEALLPTFLFVIVLFITLYMYGFSITRGIIQEKTTRIMEVLLGSLSPEQLMTGKILGIGLVGLTQIAIYVVVGLGARMAVAILLMGNQSMVETLTDALSPVKLAFFLIFFVLGYFLFSTLFAIVGAVCSTEQDAQALQFPVMMCLMIPYLLTFFFVRHPDSAASIVASFIPVFTPMVMFMRISVLMPPLWQIALSILLTAGCIYVMFRVAAKIFRIGTLMYGKRPSIPEVLRWARS